LRLRADSNLPFLACLQYYMGVQATSSQPELVGVSLVDGSITTRVPLPYTEGQFVGVGEMMTAGLPDGRVIVGG
jgi:hypothetical protein